ncbi:MAG: sulfite exporter TauE/SafE family protein [Deltaproteobacteria bacterium]|nr:sulfite exporter TauE/SafE family protein [Deltaproteobacteria bacterium]
MTPVEATAVTFAASLVAGAFGAMLGLGGGLIVVPVLTLAMGVDIRHAIGASIVSVIATSSGAAAAYLRDRWTNLRVAMFLEVGTTAGAVSGALLAGVVPPGWLFSAFGLILAASAAAMLRRGDGEDARTVPPDRVADRLGLHGTHPDGAGGETAYRVARPLPALGLMYGAGVLSGLFGIGSGIVKVPAMDLLMGMPLKASTATSNFMIGVTAATGASVYFFRGDIDPFVAAPVAAGVLGGAAVGSRLLARVPTGALRVAFVAVLAIAAARMVWQGVAG